MNPVRVSSPHAAAGIVTIQEAPSATLPQGVATAILPALLAAGVIPPLVQIGRWTCGNPEQSRSVRVQVSSLPGGTVPATNFTDPPLFGAMVLVRTQSQNGTKTSTWKAVPCDYVETAMSIEVSACGVGLPYQALPQNTDSSVNFALNGQLTCSFSERLSDPLPSLPLYPNTFAAGTGAALLVNGCAPLANTNLSQVQGFLRSLEITNGSGSAIYVLGLDAPANLTALPSATSMYQYSSWAPFIVPASTSVEKKFDDRPFFWGPWVGITAALGGAFTDGTSVLVEASYVPVQPPGV